MLLKPSITSMIRFQAEEVVFKTTNSMESALLYSCFGVLCYGAEGFSLQIWKKQLKHRR